VSYAAAQGVVEVARRYRTGTEDFLTELLGSALQGHPGLAAALCSEVQLPRGARYRVTTHVTRELPEGRWGFIDMELEVFSRGGALLGVLWAENKAPAYGFRKGQLSDYSWALRRVPVEGRLIAVVPPSTEVPNPRRLQAKARSRRAVPTSESTDEWHVVSWQRIAELATETLGSEWTRRKDHLTRGEHLVTELITYLEDQTMASTHAVQPGHVQGMSVMSATAEAVYGLLESARSKVERLSLKHAGEVDDWSPSDTDFCMYQAFARPRGSWLPTDENSGLALIVGDRWKERTISDPFIAAGAWIPATYAPQLQAQTDWVGKAVAGGFQLDNYLEDFLIAQVRPMTEVFAGRRTLSRPVES
jgi:hypothetical protein